MSSGVAIFLFIVFMVALALVGTYIYIKEARKHGK